MAQPLLDVACAAARASMLETGKIFESEGKLESAAEVYLKIIDEYPDSEEARMATKKMIGLTEMLQGEGHLNQSVSMSDRLVELTESEAAAASLEPPDGSSGLSPRDGV